MNRVPMFTAASPKPAANAKTRTQLWSVFGEISEPHGTKRVGTTSAPGTGLAVQELINGFEGKENPAPYANWLQPAGPYQLPQGRA